MICFLTAWEPLVAFRISRLPAARLRRHLHGTAAAGTQRFGRHLQGFRGRRFSRLLRPRLNDVPARLPTRCRKVPSGRRCRRCRFVVLPPAGVPAVAAQKRALALLRLLVRLGRPHTTARLLTRRRKVLWVRRLLRLLRLQRPPPATTTSIVQRPFCLRVRLQRPPPATTCRILPQR